VIEQLDSVCANVSVNGHPELRLDLPDQFRRHGRAAGQREPQAGQVARRPAGRREQRGQHRRHAPDDGAAVPSR
jgi:hypothetical protein